MKFPNKGRSAAVAAIVLSATLALATPLSAEENIFNLNIDAQPLGSAITELSQATNVVIFVPSELIAGKSAPSIRGDMTFEVALNQLLEGTELQSQRDTSGAVYITGKENKKTTTNIKREAGSKELALEEVIITAEKRAESLQDIPIAVSAFSGERMDDAGVEGMYSLQQVAPSLQVGGGFTANTFVSIRGIGSEVPSIGGEAGVAIAQDGVVFGRSAFFDADFMDVERVEVLRGPQGTISGRNATGGGINVYSRRPTETFEGRVKATVGNYNRIATEGYLSGPLVGDKVLARFAFSSDDADGWLRNTYLGEEIETRDKLHARASFLINATDDIEALFIVDATDDKSTSQGAISLGRVRPDFPSQEEYFNVAGPDIDGLTFQGDQHGSSEKKQYGVIMGLTWDVSSTATLKSTTGYWSVDVHASSDYDGTIVPLNQNPFYIVKAQQFTQELTLTADLTDRLDLILGGLYLTDESEAPLEFVSVPTGIQSYRADAKQDLTSYSAYSQLRYRLTEDLRILAGVRYTYDNKEYSDHQVFNGFDLGPLSAEKSWSAITPRVAVDYAVNDNITVFANVARGFKAGGFATWANPVDDFNPEFAWSYEAGVKASLLDDKVRLGATGFYTDYTDLQQNVFGAEDTVLPTIQNAASAEVSGIELEVEALISDALRLHTAVTWLDAQFTELYTTDTIFPELGEYDPVSDRNIRDLSGNRLARAPEWQLNIGIEYSAPITNNFVGSLRADYQWQDRIFFSFFNHDAVSQEGYGLLNLRASVEDNAGEWQLAIFARNVFDKRYLSTAYTSGLVIPTLQGDIGAPRTYGISLAKNF